MRKILLFVVAFTATIFSFAQNTLEVIDTGNITRERWRDSVLRMDKSQVPTGLLLEHSMFGFESAKYDGVNNDDDTIKNDGRVFELHNILWHSKVNGNAVIEVTDSLHKRAFFYNLTNNTVPLIFVYQPYNRIRQSSLSEGLFSIAADSVGILDVPGRPASPYDAYELFAFASFKTEIIQFNAIPFTLPDELFYMQGLTSVEVDFGDGAGFRTLAKGSSISIYYATEGLKYLTARINTAGGIRIAKCVIDYKRPATYSQPDYTQTFEVDPVYTDDAQYLGGGGMRSMMNTIILCEGSSLIEQYLCSFKPAARVEVLNGCDQVFDKPIIIVEGFDPTGTLDIEELRRRFRQSGFIATMQAYGYDFVFVNFTRNTTYIENNAKVLEAVINWVNQTKTGSFKSTVIGFSMGGLISRWCLKDMEDRSLQHNVENYFSYDAPHQGANIPLGMQYIFKEMVRDLPYIKWNSDLRKLDDAFKSPAARQMLVTYGAYNNGPYQWYPDLNTLNQLREAFAQRLQVKGYPQQTRNFGLAFGRGNNTQSTKDAGNGRQFTPANPFNPQSQIFRGSIGFLLVNAEAEANAVPENNVKATIAYYSFFGLTFRKIFGAQIVPVANLRVRRFDYTGQHPYDDAPGSFEQTQTEFARNWVAGLGMPGTTNEHDGHNFLATVSALDLQNQNYSSANRWQSSNMFFNVDNQILNSGQVNGNTLSNPALSPFRAVITGTSDCAAIGCSAEPYQNEHGNEVIPPNSNQWNHFHNTDITFQFAHFIERNILNTVPVNCAGTNGLCNRTPTISGPDRICTTGSYQLNNLPGGVTIIWSSRNGRFNITSGQGTSSIIITRLSAGADVLVASITNACGASLNVEKNISIDEVAPSIGGTYYFNGTEQPLQIFFDPGDENSACANRSTSTNMQVSGATSVVWTKLASNPSNISWSQNGNNLNFSFYGVNQTAYFRMAATNSCGTTSYDFGFRGVDCGGGGGCEFYTISPNPASNSAQVMIPDIPIPCDGMSSAQTSQLDITEITILDQSGNIQKQWKYGSKTKRVNLDLNGLKTGVYVFEIGNKTYRERKLVVIAK